jgi:uncharacterized protein YdhG (YjbR/CyaY superfamily)
MASKPTIIDEYLAALGGKQRAALEKLRKSIRAAAPKAQEWITYDKQGRKYKVTQIQPKPKKA